MFNPPKNSLRRRDLQGQSLVGSSPSAGMRVGTDTDSALKLPEGREPTCTHVSKFAHVHARVQVRTHGSKKRPGSAQMLQGLPRQRNPRGTPREPGSTGGFGRSKVATAWDHTTQGREKTCAFCGVGYLETPEKGHKSQDPEAGVDSKSGSVAQAPRG